MISFVKQEQEASPVSEPEVTESDAESEEEDWNVSYTDPTQLCPVVYF